MKKLNLLKNIILFSLFFNFNLYAQKLENSSQISISFCSTENQNTAQENFSFLKSMIERRTSIIFPEDIRLNKCKVGQSQLWWFDEKSFLNLDMNILKEHIYRGGAFIVEVHEPILPSIIKKQKELADDTVGLNWETPAKNGLFYRSFYLLQSLDGCPTEQTQVLTLRKKANAQAPIGLFTSVHFLTTGEDCYGDNQDYKIRSFINIMLAFLTTDYKEDQRDVPEILNRIRNLGLEP